MLVPGSEFISERPYQMDQVQVEQMAGGKNKQFPKLHQLRFPLLYSMLSSLENYEIRLTEAVNHLR